MDSLTSSTTTQPLITIGINLLTGLDCGLHVTVSPTAVCFVITAHLCPTIQIEHQVLFTRVLLHDSGVAKRAPLADWRHL